MKKTILTLAVVIFTAVMIFSFTTKNVQADETIITVTAPKPTKFDMFQDKKTTKGLMTPYEIKINSAKAKFIFKSVKPKTSLEVRAVKKSATVSAGWPIIVLLIEDGSLSTFGMD